jgi:hypothetical protein
MATHSWEPLMIVNLMSILTTKRLRITAMLSSMIQLRMVKHVIMMWCVNGLAEVLIKQRACCRMCVPMMHLRALRQLLSRSVIRHSCQHVQPPLIANLISIKSHQRGEVCAHIFQPTILTGISLLNARILELMKMHALLIMIVNSFQIVHMS